MKVLYTLGAIGGIIVIIEEIGNLTNKGIEWYKDYRKMKTHYRKTGKKTTDDDKMPIGFMTQKERAEVENRLKAKKAG